jgi:serine/threonine protein phosphatase PrpC
VFDGHGSDKIAQFLSKNLAKYIDDELKIHKCPIDALK